MSEFMDMHDPVRDKEDCELIRPLGMPCYGSSAFVKPTKHSAAT